MKTEDEIKQLSKQVYRHFSDLVVEIIKCFSITFRQIGDRMKTVNPELINAFFEKGQSVIIAGGHYNNWEMTAMMADSDLMHKAYALYTPLSNHYFNEKMRKSRSKYGLTMLPIKTARDFIKNNVLTPSFYIFGADQSPSRPDKCYWMTFLNQETGVQFGIEKVATEHNIPVVYASIHKKSRGYYQVSYQLITAHPQQMKYGEITEIHTKLLEQDIVQAPQYWLWTHRRWKHKKPTA